MEYGLPIGINAIRSLYLRESMAELDGFSPVEHQAFQLDKTIYKNLSNEAERFTPPD